MLLRDVRLSGRDVHVPGAGLPCHVDHVYYDDPGGLLPGAVRMHLRGLCLSHQ
jgi:hypothetical protein